MIEQVSENPPATEENGAKSKENRATRTARQFNQSFGERKKYRGSQNETIVVVKIPV
jgi:hypothetical protein